MKAGGINPAIIRKKADAYRDEMTGFLRELIAIPSPSGQEKQIVGRVRQEMQQNGFDEILIDDFGTIAGRLGSRGPRIVFDSHLDMSVSQIPQRGISIRTKVRLKIMPCGAEAPLTIKPLPPHSSMRQR